jgi:hypothetical protein
MKTKPSKVPAKGFSPNDFQAVNDARIDFTILNIKDSSGNVVQFSRREKEIIEQRFISVTRESGKLPKDYSIECDVFSFRESDADIFKLYPLDFFFDIKDKKYTFDFMANLRSSDGSIIASTVYHSCKIVHISGLDTYFKIENSFGIDMQMSMLINVYMRPDKVSFDKDGQLLYNISTEI